MTTNTATVTQTAAPFSRDGLHSKRIPIWLGAVVAVIGGAIAIFAVKADWMFLGDGYRFALRQTDVAMACGGLALLVGGVTVMLPGAWRRPGEWLLVVVAALAVIVAADISINFSGEPSAGPTENASKPTHLRARRTAFLKAAQEAASHDPTSKFVMLLFLGGAVGLVRSSAPAREQRDATTQARSVAADIPAVTRFLSLEVQLGLLVLVMQQFNLVSPLFNHQIMLLIFFGFLVHYFLPFEYRLPFFLFLSLSAIACVFGVTQASWLVAIGLTLIGFCHVPVSFKLRLVLVTLAGCALAELRVGWFHAPWSDAIWPILASMFMFRLIVYLYSLKHRKAPVTFWSSLSYFFLLPNIVFPLFPVVDYATFYRNYYDADRHLIHQRGLKWIFWGVIHLLLYRYIYYYVVIAPDAVDSVTDLVRYLISNFLLILRLSGQFHLVIGVLLLFGFDLPRIMNRYWHASSFTDFWRRANIYWRDFMQRVVFYPIYFRLRHWPATATLLFATGVVFFITWALHGYQWFWIRGSYSTSGPDVLFWSVFGVLVAANTLYDAKAAARKATTTGAQRSFTQIALHTLRIMGVFSTICVLWSIWISSSLAEWVSLWNVPAPTWNDVKVLTPVLLAGIALAAWGALAARKEELRGLGASVTAPAAMAEKSFLAAALPTGAAIVALLLVSLPGVYEWLTPKFAGTMDDMRQEKLSRTDLAMMERGYYENLTRVERFNSQLWERYNKAPAQPPEPREGDEANSKTPSRFADDDWRVNYLQTAEFIGILLRPNLGKPGEDFQTNRWGMRDKDYEQKPPPRTLRIAMVGGSPEVYKGVPNDKLWPTVVEDRLNAENDHRTYNQYEILNFAAATHTALHRLAMVENKVIAFQPDILWYIAHPSDRTKSINRLAEIVMTGTPIPYDYLRQLVQKTGLKRDMQIRTMRARLAPYGNELMNWIYRQIVQDCREHSILPVFMYLPNLKPLGEEETPDHLRLASEAGFKVLNLSGIFEGYDEKTLHRNDWDFHPNTQGHAIIAARLYETLKKNPDVMEKTKTQVTKR
jgi:D-alanyl-lipoteichoic acid acyltransferase DltB (MBOAT superfamily)